MNLESQKGNVPVSTLIKSLKKQVSHIQIDEPRLTPKNSLSSEPSVEDGSDSALIDTTDSAIFNLNGELVRKSI